MQHNASRRERWYCRPAGVPRRFGVGKLLMMTALFSVLFGILQILMMPPIVFFVLIFFSVGVGAAQAILYQGKQPRRASVLAGAIFGATAAPLSLFALMWEHGVPLEYEVLLGFLAASIVGALPGAAFGYVAGCLIAGLFLIKEREDAETPDAEAVSPNLDPTIQSGESEDRAGH
jgi:apolipoprotein N-acyltransferase